MNINREEISKLAGFVGAAMALAGYFRHLIQEMWGWFNISLVAVGGVLFLLSLVLNFGAIKAFFSGRGGRLGANTALLTVGVIGLLAVANFLGYRHHKRFDLTAEGLYSISDQTKKIVGALQKDVKVLRFDKNEDPQLADLMAEYKYVSKRISYERIDPQQKLEVARQYKDKLQGPGDILVICGDRSERAQGATEQDITNAILKVTRDTLKTVCFTEGHGEKDLAGTDGQGYATIDKRLKNENYTIKSVSLVKDGQVPAECSVLIVAGPKQPFFPPEAAGVGKYLDAGGKAMFLLDPETETGLDDVLKTWNVEVTDNLALDFSVVSQLFGGGPGYLLVSNYGQSPITRGLTGQRTIFPMARALKISSGGTGGANTTSLLTTSEQSFAKTGGVKSGQEVQFEEGKDIKGPLTLGVTGTRNVGGKEARLVAIGDSDFAVNGFARFQLNYDLFLNSVGWLAQEEDLISIRAKTATNRSVMMSESQQRTFFWGCVLILPLLVLGAGAYIWWKRR
ncbi:MAG: GldG family protein [Acidobacteria bacterium]|nr:GldG family protein [Acidobacteriota bacterium]